jgi:hypothetical protein
MTTGESRGWHYLFLQAILEPQDSSQLSRLVKEAEIAMSGRLQELRVSVVGGAERDALCEAFVSLRLLRERGIARSTSNKDRTARAS